MLDGGGIEGEAEAALTRAQLPLDESPRALALATGLLGPGAVEIVRGRLSTRAALARVGDQWRVYLRAGLDPLDARWCVAHELAEYVLARLDYRGEDVERVADRLAAAMLVPARLVRALAWRRLDAVPLLAERAGVTCTSAALRMGEAAQVPLVVVAPTHVHARGPESWAWPSEAELRKLARRGAPGVARAKLDDDPRRVALVVDEDGAG